MTAITVLINGTLVSKAALDTESLLSKLMDILALLGTVNMDLNQFSRDLVRPDVKPEFQNLCNKANPGTTLLFRDDVSKQWNKLSDARQVSRCLNTGYRSRGRPTGSRPFRGRGRANYRGGQRPFLSQGKGSERQSPNKNKQFKK
ncbi:hypothetical protein HOLleu_19063 [Holothuria leucospilota]|uniref:Uncharacterized protein n=1 Tax=Holothuria leucospilota TaxID=206669 RepID=A0A9Q1C3S8_HOLLE|nr:hypothetical protein HOLleu_19063 [Holothuria leucospilota]